MRKHNCSTAAGSSLFASLHGSKPAFVTKPNNRHKSHVKRASGHASTVLVVESPTKAKKIQQFLGPDFKVLASYGHIRDLPAKSGSVLPPSASADDGDEASSAGEWRMSWEMSKKALPRLYEIQQAINEARSSSPTPRLILATDPDREGEAISWHLVQAMTENGTLPSLAPDASKTKKGTKVASSSASSSSGIEVQRIVFHEITKKAILQALASPRDVSQPLVDAYLARRSLDYLVGFNISPVLWRRLPGAKSAGRVQSVALRLVTTREDEIDAFESTEYWTLDLIFITPKGERVHAKLTHADGEKIKDMGIQSQSEAQAIMDKIKSSGLAMVVEDPTLKSTHRRPPAPFTTSSMQQEANKKLGFNATRTMSAAQSLYEEGHISYMRTDGVSMSPEAIEDLRMEVVSSLGKEYVSSSIRVYKAKAKNAQEAHEAIRPIKPQSSADSLADTLAGDLLSLYGLIWRRTLASQMSDSVTEQVSIGLKSEGGLRFKASASSLAFPGFLKILSPPSLAPISNSYPDPGGGAEGEEEEGGGGINHSRSLSALKKDDVLRLVEVISSQHFTRPPARFTDASLIKAMEELGIGRPSTYASVLNVLLSRGYVTKEGSALIPSSLGRVLVGFLVEFFPKYVDYDFTSKVEEQLDEVSDGKRHWATGVLDSFWPGFQSSIQSVMKNNSITSVFDVLDERLGPYLFKSAEQAKDHQEGEGGSAASDPRQCPLCQDGRLSLKPSSLGGFIGCSNYESKGCRFARPLVFSQPLSSEAEGDVAVLETMLNEGHEIGFHPETGLMLSIKSGPYGLFLEEAVPVVLEGEGEGEGEGDAGLGKKKGRSKKKVKAPKPRRATLPKDLQEQPSQVTLETAVALLALPKVLGLHPVDSLPVSVNTGRFGPYAAHNGIFASLSSLLKSRGLVGSEISGSVGSEISGSDAAFSIAEILVKEVGLDAAVKLVDAKREKVKEKMSKFLSHGGKISGMRPTEKERSEVKASAAVMSKTPKKLKPAREVAADETKPRSLYQSFVKAEYAATKASLQELSTEAVKMGQVSVALGQKWKQLSNEEKASYSA